MWGFAHQSHLDPWGCPRALAGTLSGSCQRIPEEHLDGIALIGAIATSIRAKVAALFERIELRVGDVD
jgi:hypothetical protein